MANPTTVSCTQNTWVKVATNVKTGMIHKRTKKRSTYLQTYRLTGEAAPTNRNEGIEAFSKCGSISIGSDVEIDVYIMCLGTTGSVRVDV